MKGFFRRDVALLAANLWFYLIFILCFGVLAAFTDFASGFVSLYVMIFSAASIMNLFSYDDANRWQGYAATAPGGRGAMVDARYVLCLCLAGAVFLIQLLLDALDGRAALVMAGVYAGAFLLYAAILLPLAYRFGGTRGRLLMLIVIGVLSGLIAAAGSVMVISGGPAGWKGAGLGWLALPVLALGLAAMAVSHRISRAIMAGKEL